MQIIDSGPITAYLVVIGIAAALAIAVAAVALSLAIRETRRERLLRHESIPTYYGRLHFAH